MALLCRLIYENRKHTDEDPVKLVTACHSIKAPSKKGAEKMLLFLTSRDIEDMTRHISPFQLRNIPLSFVASGRMTANSHLPRQDNSDVFLRERQLITWLDSMRMWSVIKALLGPAPYSRLL